MIYSWLERYCFCKLAHFSDSPGTSRNAQLVTEALREGDHFGLVECGNTLRPRFLLELSHNWTITVNEERFSSKRLTELYFFVFLFIVLLLKPCFYISQCVQTKAMLSEGYFSA